MKKQKTIRLTVDMTYNPEAWHGDEPEAIEWFYSILNGDDLQLGEFGEVGDMIGTVKVVHTVPMPDPRVTPPDDLSNKWQPIETAPKDRLIDIWLGEGRRWCDCYYDRITDTWRTSRPSGKLISIQSRFVTHWRPLPAPPDDLAERVKGE